MRWLFVLMLLAVGALASPPSWAIHKCTDANGHTTYQNRPCVGAVESQALDIEITPRQSGYSTEWRCDRRNSCTAMTSCREAYFFMRQCGKSGFDTDRNGIPCDTSVCQGIDRAAPSTVRPAEAARIEQMSRNNRQTSRDRQQARSNRAESAQAHRQRCEEKRAEISRIRERYRRTRDYDQMRRGNRIIWEIRSWLQTNCTL